MGWVLIVGLGFLLVILVGISGSLRDIAEHNLKFPPPEREVGEKIAEGDVIVVAVGSAYGMPCKVLSVQRLEDGVGAHVEPIGGSNPPEAL